MGLGRTWRRTAWGANSWTHRWQSSSYRRKSQDLNHEPQRKRTFEFDPSHFLSGLSKKGPNVLKLITTEMVQTQKCFKSRNSRSETIS